MDYFVLTLEGIKLLLTTFHKDSYAGVIDDCIEQWNKNHHAGAFIQAFSDKNGKLSDLSFAAEDFKSEEQAYWTQQMLGALMAMAAQLAVFAQRKQTMTIEFMRKYFGHPTELINGTVCGQCGAKSISQTDIDNFIAPDIIAAKIVDGLEDGKLNERILSVVNVTATEIDRQRRLTKIRIENSSVPMTGSRHSAECCMVCGSNNMKPCRFLKSLKENVFISLGK